MKIAAQLHIAFRKNFSNIPAVVLFSDKTQLINDYVPGWKNVIFRKYCRSGMGGFYWNGV